MNIRNTRGLSIHILENGSVERIEADPVRISLKASTLFSIPGNNIYLRKKNAPIEFTALTGPKSESHFHIDHDNCLEIIAVRGESTKLTILANKLIALKGIQHGKLIMSNSE